MILNSEQDTQKNTQDDHVIWLNPKSRGKVEDICGLKIGLPGKPKNSEIDNNDLRKNNQKFTREDLPYDFDLMSSKEQNSYIDREFDRRENGYWFYNNGEPTYITGNHYYYIQWCKIDIGYPEYRERDRRFFLFWEACKIDPRSYGMIMVKHRREGASWKAASLVLNDITRMYNSHGGLLSKTGSDAKDLFAKVVYMFRELPFFFQPIIDGTDNPKSVLSFNAPGQKITKNNKSVVKTKALNSKIDFRNTRENSYDSTKLKVFICDEAGKWTEASVRKNWQVVKPCLTQGRDVIGKCFMPSTVNELSAQGGENFKKLWDDSDITNRDDNGETTSGLYRYFTPAYDGFEGFIDQYGNSDIEDAKKYLENKRESLKGDTTSLSEEKRQRPFTPEEAFRSDVTKSIFDVERIYQQIEFNEVNPHLVTRGNFFWRNGQRDTTVGWIPDPKGKWLVSYLPTSDKQNLKERGRNGWRPLNDIEYSAGCDPYDHDTTTDGRRSDAATYVFRKYNPILENTNIFVSEYINRPPKADIFYEDMIMQQVFYGCQILVENNKIGIIKYFQNRGYDDYLMERPDSTHTNFSRGQKTKGIPSTGAAVINTQADIVQAYIYDNVGTNHETGEIGACYFNHLLSDWAEFDITNRTKHDATVASSLALMASQKHIIQKKKVKDFKPFVKKYRV